MGNWSPEGWVVFFGAAGTFIALLTANLVTVIKAARDRQTIAAATTTQLTEIAKATGAPVTATVPGIVEVVNTPPPGVENPAGPNQGITSNPTPPPFTIPPSP